MMPAASLRNELRLTRHIVAHVAQFDPLPHPTELPGLLLEVGADMKSLGDLPRRLHRTAVSRAAVTFGLAYCWDYLRPDWKYAADEVRAAAEKLEGSARRAQDSFHPLDPRLAWWTEDDWLVIDELHGTHLGDGLLDDWMRRRIAGDLAAGRALAGDRFAGVRLCSLRAVNASAVVTSLTDEPLPLADSPLCKGGVPV